MGRRSLPTPGSTMATWIVPGGKCREAECSRYAPARMLCAGTSWVRSTIWAWGLIPRMTPFMLPTNTSAAPKSVSSVISEVDGVAVMVHGSELDDLETDGEHFVFGHFCRRGHLHAVADSFTDECFPNRRLDGNLPLFEIRLILADEPVAL